MAFPTRTGPRFALPASAGGHSSAMARPSAANASRYRSAAQHVWGGARNIAHRGRSAVSRGHASAAGALARAGSHESSLGGIFARSLAPALTVGVLGALNGTPAGQRFTAWTNGFVKPGDAITILGGLARATNVDRRFLGKHVERINVSLLTGMFPVFLYRLGEWAPGAMMRGFASAASAKPAAPKTAGALGGAANGTAKPAGIEVVPGEQTFS